MRRRLIIVSFSLLTALFLLFILPNLINSREQNQFSSEYQMKQADALFSNNDSDSINISISKFYDRNSITTALFGNHYRELWSKKIKLPVFKGLDTLEFHKVGGGHQTTSIEMKSPNHMHYSFRSIDKDQSRVLHSWLRNSALRPLLRDQTSALNPYAAPVVASLSETVNILHTNPTIYILPYHSQVHDSIKFHLPASAVIFEEELDSKWKDSKTFFEPTDIINTEEMLTAIKNADMKLDTLEYLKCRIFDVLISDWDRHAGQWKWLVYDTLDHQTIRPFPIDRDMAFCRFDDGWVNTIVVNTTNKFESFRKGEASVNDAAKKITDLDVLLLKGLSKASFKRVTSEIQNALSESAIDKAMKQYPTEIHKIIAVEQKATLMDRLDHLEGASIQLYDNINN
ncbi:hypothetical protein [Fulvivirga lutimaris]|uniref:hypothetical protein n=1 Tax=Fulvivirga lutimaris TaxID=1819566 RepID=UPI0012BC89A2|nr:hypothetical protein [Fulvivirga lutimaris]MTI38917.1 hypothetical protein [Fulvivirga lutimaris]